VGGLVNLPSTSGMSGSGLAPKWVRLAPNETNTMYGTFSYQISVNLGSVIGLKLDKSEIFQFRFQPDLSHLGPI